MADGIERIAIATSTTHTFVGNVKVLMTELEDV
jgi:hypothetical protein